MDINDKIEKVESKRRAAEALLKEARELEHEVVAAKGPVTRSSLTNGMLLGLACGHTAKVVPLVYRYTSEFVPLAYRKTLAIRTSSGKDIPLHKYTEDLVHTEDPECTVVSVKYGEGVVRTLKDVENKKTASVAYGCIMCALKDNINYQSRMLSSVYNITRASDSANELIARLESNGIKWHNLEDISITAVKIRKMTKNLRDEATDIQDELSKLAANLAASFARVISSEKKEVQI